MTLMIEPEDLAIVQAILTQYLGTSGRAWVYGSRSGRGRLPRRGSDLDLLIDRGSPISFSTLSEMADAFSESLLPYMVDLHDRNDTDPAFLARISADLVPLPLPVQAASD